MPDSVNIKIIRSNRRTLAMQVLPDLTLVIKAPISISQREIDRFVQGNESWIQKQKLRYQQTIVEGKTYQNGEKFLFLGKYYSLKTGSYQKISVEDDSILFPQVLIFRGQKELINWYIHQAQTIITQQVQFYAKQIGVEYQSITLSDTKSKWGTCTYDNRLQFSWRLVMAPLIVLNYVVIHELVHIIEKNHSYSFWNKVRHFTPSYKQQVKWLKDYGHSLIV